jgi:hypothetical protein
MVENATPNRGASTIIMSLGLAIAMHMVIKTDEPANQTRPTDEEGIENMKAEAVTKLIVGPANTIQIVTMNARKIVGASSDPPIAILIMARKGSRLEMLTTGEGFQEIMI